MEDLIEGMSGLSSKDTVPENYSDDCKLVFVTEDTVRDELERFRRVPIRVLPGAYNSDG